MRPASTLRGASFRVRVGGSLVAASMIIAMGAQSASAEPETESSSPSPSETSSEPAPAPADSAPQPPSQDQTPTPSGSKPKPKPTPTSNKPTPSATAEKDDKEKDDKEKNKDKDKDLSSNVPQAVSWAEQGVDDVGIKGVDVSHWTHPDNQPIDWVQVRKAGVRWMYTKCSDGTGTPGDYDRWGPTDIVEAEKAKIPSGCYHYAQPGSGSTDLRESAILQARVAVDRQPSPAPRLPLVLDLEETGELDSASLAEWAYIFLTEAEKLTGRAPWMYGSTNFLMTHLANEERFQRFGIWVAAYGTHWGADPPEVPTWAKRVAWQFSSQGEVAGIPGSNVDLNIFLRSPQSLRKYTTPVAPTAEPTPPATVPAPQPSFAPFELGRTLHDLTDYCSHLNLSAASVMGAVPNISFHHPRCPE